MNNNERFLKNICNLKKLYQQDGYLFIASEQMIELLQAMGISIEKINQLKEMSDNLPSDPTLEFRESRNGRFFHNNLSKVIYRTEFQPLIKDNEFKHSLSPVFQMNLKERATRDMLIFFTRKPCLEKHISFPYDSIKPHPDYPVDFELE